VGNGPTLTKSESIWGKLVSDAKDRGCFFNWDADKGITSEIDSACTGLRQLSLHNIDSPHISKASTRYNFLATFFLFNFFEDLVPLFDE